MYYKPGASAGRCPGASAGSPDSEIDKFTNNTDTTNNNITNNDYIIIIVA